MGKLTNISDGRVATRTGEVTFTLHVDHKPVPVEMTFDELGQTIVTLLDIAAAVADASRPNGTALPATVHGPIQTLSAGLQVDGIDPNTVGLILNLRGFAMVFEVPRASARKLGMALVAMTDGDPM